MFSSQYPPPVTSSIFSVLVGVHVHAGGYEMQLLRDEQAGLAGKLRRQVAMMGLVPYCFLVLTRVVRQMFFLPWHRLLVCWCVLVLGRHDLLCHHHVYVLFLLVPVVPVLAALAGGCHCSSGSIPALLQMIVKKMPCFHELVR